MPVKWKDTSTFSRDDRERIPTTWTAEVASLRITVTRGHIYHKGEWVMHCAPWFDTRSLGPSQNVSPEEAQEKALAMVRAKVAALNAALGD